MEYFDVVVVGAGLAGLQCARLLSGHGLHVLLADRKSSLDQAIHTTGIFVRRSLEDFGLPPSCLGPPIRRVTLYSPARRALVLDSPRDEFRVARMGTLYARLLKDCQAAGATCALGTSFLGCEPTPEGSLVRLESEGGEQVVSARYLVAADGAASRVAAALGLSANRHWIVGVEEVFDDVPFAGPPQLHCFLDRRVAPGYIAWVTEDGQAVHVGVGGYRSRFRPSPALDAFRATIGDIVNLRAGRLVERRAGRIPVGGILRDLANRRGLLIGDAAGAVSPLTAGGLDPCLRLSEIAAKVIWRFLSTGDPVELRHYDGQQFRRTFRTRRAMRMAFSLAAHNAVLEAGCALLRSRVGKRLARSIFFGSGSLGKAASPERVAWAGKPLARNPQNAKPIALN
ncbi:MAG TPA: NAD(P)/FAD-dependent oxidoreductase [Pirellulales bacterium]|jgi:flavin-dependent dehydrogenase|nr:NAD(P)/FAD-dependent oxidoreductase [Pirellulales bacterium]